MPDKLPYILAAPNGARRTKADHPNLPVTVEQTIKTAGECFAAGANGLHLHIRDDDGQHSLDAGRYREAMVELANKLPEMEIQITTESAGRFDVAAQLNCIKLAQPSWVSMSVREVNRAPDLAEGIYGFCADMGVQVQHILYNPTDAELLAEWQGKSIVRPGQDARLLVLGRYSTGEAAKIAEIDGFEKVGALTGEWMVCAFGPMEHECLLAAAARGGNVRVGFENSLTNSDGNIWDDNAASVTALRAALVDQE